MRYWSVSVSADRYGAERLYDHDLLEMAVPEGASPGDRVALVAATEPPVVFALGEVRSVQREIDPDDPDSFDEEAGAVIAYTQRCFDAPVPATALPRSSGPVAAETFDAVARRLPRTPGVPRSWLVSVDLPIEAETPAEAVRRYWTYVRQLGPQELPTFVSPTGDELAMQAFVLGREANLDPEEPED